MRQSRNDLILCLLFAGAIAAPAVGAAALPDSSTAEPWLRDFAVTPNQVRLYAAKLGAENTGERHEAAQRLAWARVGGMGLVDSLVEAGNLRDTTAIKDYLSLALLASVTPAELEAFPKLQAVAAYEISKGLATEPENGAFLSDRHLLLRGFAVPGAVLLCANERPYFRARGIRVLREIQAVAQLPLLRSMRTDKATYSLSHGDYSTGESVGGDAATAVARMEGDLTGRFRYEIFIPNAERLDGGDHSALVTGLRAYGQTLSQKTWESWWDAARPVWSAWWDLCGDSPTHADVHAWWIKIGKLTPPGKER